MTRTECLLWCRHKVTCASYKLANLRARVRYVDGCVACGLSTVHRDRCYRCLTEMSETLRHFEALWHGTGIETALGEAIHTSRSGHREFALSVDDPCFLFNGATP